MKLTVTNAQAVDVAAGVPSPYADESSARTFLIANVTGTAVVYLENKADAEATEANGFPWDGADALTARLEPGEVLRGIVAAGGADQELRVLRVGR